MEHDQAFWDDCAVEDYLIRKHFRGTAFTTDPREQAQQLDEQIEYENRTGQYEKPTLGEHPQS